MDFMNDQFVVSKIHNEEYGGLKFSELPDEVKHKFLEYEMSIELLVGATDGDVLDVFARINSYTVTLNKLELLNAKYNGIFKQTVFELGREHLEFWIRNRILRDRGIARMKEAELCTDLVIAMVDGIHDNKRKTIELYFRRWDDEFPERSAVVDQFRHCIDHLAGIYSGIPLQSVFRNPVLFYSLFLVIFDMSFGLPGSNARRVTIKEDMLARIRGVISNLEGELKAEAASPEFALFKDATKRSTADRSKRELRHRVILEEIMKSIGG